MTLVVDLRRAFDSGLGTYIRNVVPRTLALLEGVSGVGLIAPGEDARHLAYLGARPPRLQPASAAPLTLWEQWELPRLLPADAVFWATTLAHPLLTRRPLVATVHDVIQLAVPGAASGAVAAASRVYLRNLQRRARLLMFDSQFTAADFARHVGPLRHANAVVPLGVDCAAWQAATSAAAMPEPLRVLQRPYFLFVGNLRPHKNLVTVLDAFAAIAARLPHALAIVGRADGFRSHDDAALQRLAADPQRVLQLGPIGGDALRHCMQNAAALLVPSLHEGFGLPVLEGMAAGCPVVASNAASLPEAGGEAAVYVDPLDVAGWSRAMLDVAQWSAAEREQRVARARHWAQACSWDRTAALTAAAITPHLASRHTRAGAAAPT